MCVCLRDTVAACGQVHAVVGGPPSSITSRLGERRPGPCPFGLPRLSPTQQDERGLGF